MSSMTMTEKILARAGKAKKVSARYSYVYEYLKGRG